MIKQKNNILWSILIRQVSHVNHAAKFAFEQKNVLPKLRDFWLLSHVRQMSVTANVGVAFNWISGAKLMQLAAPDAAWIAAAPSHCFFSVKVFKL